jgi:hypothetical protein
MTDTLPSWAISTIAAYSSGIIGSIAAYASGSIKPVGNAATGRNAYIRIIDIAATNIAASAIYWTIGAIFTLAGLAGSVATGPGLRNQNNAKTYRQNSGNENK